MQQRNRVEGLSEVPGVYERLRDSIRQAVVGKDRVVDLCLVTLFAGGHVC